MPRILALYLPQFHPIPENDAWWSPGFTEWTNVAKAKPLFRGHRQPRIPADLGFYDLRLAETREQQAQLAREAGIEGFCYYHYWFGNGRQLLERPFREVVESGKPDFPFCLCWANHSWSNKTWNRKSALQSNSMLLEQQYPDDDEQHFLALLPAFKDSRYVRIDGRPVFVLYEPFRHTHVRRWIETWRRLALEHGLPGLYLVGMTPSTLTLRLDADGLHDERVMPNLESSAQIYNAILDMGFDAVNSYGKRRGEMLCEGRIWSILKRGLRKLDLNFGKKTINYPDAVAGYFAPEDSWENVFPTILPQWDRSPRVSSADGVYINANPSTFEAHIKHALTFLKDKSAEHQVLFLKSWNEWGEGNYVEPDEQFGHGWLDAIRKSIK